MEKKKKKKQEYEKRADRQRVEDGDLLSVNFRILNTHQTERKQAVSCRFKHLAELIDDKVSELLNISLFFV